MSLEDRAGDTVTNQQLRKLTLRTFWKFAKRFNLARGLVNIEQSIMV